MGKRHKARECALQALYQLDLRGWERGDESAAQLLASAHRGMPLPPSYEEYAAGLVEGVIAERDRIDALLAKASHEWQLARMAAVDRNLLRLATYEVLCEEATPTAVILEEAVLLAKRFGDKNSPAFVNALLDRIAREQRQGASKATEEGEALP